MVSVQHLEHDGADRGLGGKLCVDVISATCVDWRRWATGGRNLGSHDLA